MECESIPEDFVKKVGSSEEYEARLATALQTPGKMQVTWFENDQGQLVLPGPSPVIQMGNMDLAGRLRPNITNAAGEGTEENSLAIFNEVTSIDSNVAKTNIILENQSMETWGADGTPSGTTVRAPWVVYRTEQITADGNGNIGAEAAIIGAGTTRIDAWWLLQVSTTGSYTTQWGQDATGTLAPTFPDYHTANQVLNLIAGVPYLFRVINTIANLNIGYGIGTNGEWPNNSTMVISGWTRELV